MTLEMACTTSASKPCAAASNPARAALSGYDSKHCRASDPPRLSTLTAEALSTRPVTTLLQVRKIGRAAPGGVRRCVGDRPRAQHRRAHWRRRRNRLHGRDFGRRPRAAPPVGGKTPHSCMREMTRIGAEARDGAAKSGPCIRLRRNMWGWRGRVKIGALLSVF